MFFDTLQVFRFCVHDSLEPYAICRKSYDTKLESRISFRMSPEAFAQPIIPNPSDPIFRGHQTQERAPAFTFSGTFGECGPDVGTSKTSVGILFPGHQPVTLLVQSGQEHLHQLRHQRLFAIEMVKESALVTAASALTLLTVTSAMPLVAASSKAAFKRESLTKRGSFFFMYAFFAFVAFMLESLLNRLEIVFY
ncbi:MAG TPA: hypothetical protein VNZ26_26455, partial [Vicinamibacterales bacterium]|nr:hypothetical protein [Vicinamibacterales bacterium]